MGSILYCTSGALITIIGTALGILKYQLILIDSILNFGVLFSQQDCIHKTRTLTHLFASLSAYLIGNRIESTHFSRS